MTLVMMMIWLGVVLTVAGLALLGWCIWRALAIKRAGDTVDGTAQMQRLIAFNMAAVGIASIGLAFVVVGVILA